MCGDNLTRENVMKQAASLKDFAPDTLLPGVKINTSATDFAPIEPAADDAVQGREVGPVRRHHQRRPQQLIFRPRGLSRRRPAHIESPLRPRSQGAFSCWQAAKGIQCAPRAAKRSRSRTVTHSHDLREIKMPAIPIATGEPFGRRRSARRDQQRRARAEEIRHRRHRYRNQDRQHHALQRTCLRLRRDRQDRRGLLQEDQRRGRHQRPQDQFHQL